ncbi:MAG: hypothetical protein ACOYPS_01840 [Phycisphaerales bacterium]
MTRAASTVRGRDASTEERLPCESFSTGFHHPQDACMSRGTTPATALGFLQSVERSLRLPRSYRAARAGAFKPGPRVHHPVTALSGDRPRTFPLGRA